MKRYPRIVALLFAMLALRAQQDPVFTTDGKVVNLLATVRSNDGAYARDLGKDDFLLSEDGRPQTIRYFATQSDLPLKLGLLVDTSASQKKLMPEVDPPVSTELPASPEVVRPVKDPPRR